MKRYFDRLQSNFTFVLISRYCMHFIDKKLYILPKAYFEQSVLCHNILSIFSLSGILSSSISFWIHVKHACAFSLFLFVESIPFSIPNFLHPVCRSPILHPTFLWMHKDIYHRKAVHNRSYCQSRGRWWFAARSHGVN